MWSFKEWRRRRVLRRSTIDEAAWRDASAALPFLRRLNADEHRRLRELAILFLAEKSIETTGDLQLTEHDRLTLALQACLPILNLGLDWYAGWVSVIVYPDEFVSEHDAMDEAGVVHRIHEIRSGESWLQGPVVLAWEEIANPSLLPGHNLIIHEFAHKLDMLNGDANGLPPLQPGMNVADWAQNFQTAYKDFQHRADSGATGAIDPYAAEAPEEFFAVLSEVFFIAPHELSALYPAVYDQLKRFYRQDPLTTS